MNVQEWYSSEISNNMLRHLKMNTVVRFLGIDIKISESSSSRAMGRLQMTTQKYRRQLFLDIFQLDPKMYFIDLRNTAVLQFYISF